MNSTTHKFPQWHHHMMQQMEYHSYKTKVKLLKLGLNRECIYFNFQICVVFYIIILLWCLFTIILWWRNYFYGNIIVCIKRAFVRTYVRYVAILCVMYSSTCTSALRHECTYWSTCADEKYTSTRSLYKVRRICGRRLVKFSKKRRGVR